MTQLSLSLAPLSLNDTALHALALAAEQLLKICNSSFVENHDVEEHVTGRLAAALLLQCAKRGAYNSS